MYVQWAPAIYFVHEYRNLLRNYSIILHKHFVLIAFLQLRRLLYDFYDSAINLPEESFLSRITIDRIIQGDSLNARSAFHNNTTKNYPPPVRTPVF